MAENSGTLIMWIEPSQFSKKKLVSPAIYKRNNRKIAKIAAHFNSETSIGKLEDANLSLTHQQKILTWFSHIGEKDQHLNSGAISSDNFRISSAIKLCYGETFSRRINF